MTPVNPAFTADEITKVLRASRATAVVASAPAAATVACPADAAGVPTGSCWW